MTLITRTITFYVILKCGNTHYDYRDYYKEQHQRPSEYEYQNIPQTNYENARVSPLLVNNYDYMADQCICSCDVCYISPKECCFQFCQKCADENNQAGYLVVPYPYYVINSPNSSTAKPTDAPQKIEVTTTEVTTMAPPETTTHKSPVDTIDGDETSTLDPEDVIREHYMKELIENSNPSYKNEKNNDVIMTSLRRTRPRWMPKFGIVPIPDQLAEKLMLRIRNMKVLHPEKDTVRRIESIYPRSEY